MPELPDITVYLEAIERRAAGQALRQLRVGNPFVLRTAQPPITRFLGTKLRETQRLGKRIALGFEKDLWAVIHLMIAGRLHWEAKPRPLRRKLDLLAFDFEAGSLILTEAGTKRRASLHLFEGEEALREVDPAGLEVLQCRLEDFRAALLSENHTLKRALTDPRLFSGVGNAYSDEILHAARLSPITHTRKLSAVEIQSLFEATRSTLRLWIERLRQEAGNDFPEKVTAFRPEMAVHGKFGKPCPVCQASVQRIRYAENETNYCPGCQTGGKILADRSLSLLLKADWPRSVEEWEALMGSRRR